MKIVRALVLVLLLIAASWQFIQMAYIYGKAEVAQMLLERAWDENIQQSRRGVVKEGVVKEGVVSKRPWSWSDSWPVGKLIFPRHEKELIVLSNGTGRSLAFAPSHLSGSAVLGEQGVSVIGGHKDTHFKFLEQVKINDKFWLQLPSGRFKSYRVNDVEITDVSSSEILLDSDRPMIVLVACYPFSSFESGGPLRYLVIAEPYAGVPEEMVSIFL